MSSPDSTVSGRRDTSRTPSVVALTSGNGYGVSVARALSDRGVPFRIVLQCDAAPSLCFRMHGWRRILEAPVALARSAMRLRRSLRWRRTLRRYAAHVVLTGARNSPRMRADLTRLSPELLVLAGIGLLDAALLAVPRWGTVNGHPALLPWVRGNGVVAHSIARGVALGASVHHVDAGIDRGAVLARRLLAVAPDMRELYVLEREALLLAASLLADVVAQAVRAGGLPPGAPQTETTPLCRWMQSAERAQVEAAVRAGVAGRLQAAWRGREGVEMSPHEETGAPFPSH
jgi:hypothetical protein